MDNADTERLVDKPFGDPPPKFHIAIGWQTIWKAIAAILVTLLALWAAGEASNLLFMPSPSSSAWHFSRRSSGSSIGMSGGGAQPLV